MTGCSCAPCHDLTCRLSCFFVRLCVAACVSCAAVAFFVCGVGLACGSRNLLGGARACVNVCVHVCACVVVAVLPAVATGERLAAGGQSGVEANDDGGRQLADAVMAARHDRGGDSDED